MIGSLILPFPPWQVEPLSLVCHNHQPRLIDLSRCPQGRLVGILPRFRLTLRGDYRYDFSSPDKKIINLAPLHIGPSSWEMQYNQHGDRWQLDLETQGQTLAPEWIKPILPASLQWIENISGQLAVLLQAEGNTHPTRLELDIDGQNLSLHDPDYSKVLEKLKLFLKGNVSYGKKGWTGYLHASADQGEFLFLPIYFPLASNAVKFQSAFLWNQDSRQLKFWDARFLQRQVGAMVGFGTIDNGIISNLTTGFRMTLPTSYRLYVQPLLEGGDWQGLTVKTGKAQGRFTIALNRPEKGRIVFDDVTITDAEHRIGVNNLNARLYWQRTFQDQWKLFPTSWISWHAAHLYAIPFGEADLFIRLTDDDLRLIHPASLPVLDGRLRIQQFDLLNLTSTPQIRLAGEIETISLELLTRVLGIPPLSGSLSGHVPGVQYDHESHTLELDGKLTIKVFDGTVTIENLVVTNLFGSLPRLRADVYFNNLDLELVTRHFSFGKITGRLGGYIKSLYLENWRPISLEAWFATPSDDTSKHRISQQAVNSLTDLGGGGATGLISRTFLRVFEDFIYDRIGLGLKLSNNICELRGIAPAPNGYYIVTGRGLPRIDVIGYNRLIDWPTLLARLKRITQIQTPVVQ